MFNIIRYLSSTIYRKRSFYQMMQEAIGDHGTSRHKLQYAIDCVAFLYCHKIFWMTYVIYVDYAPVLDWNVRKNDVELGFLYKNRHSYDAFLLIPSYMFVLLYWLCQTAIWRLNPNAATWQWWYRFVVEDQDAYLESMLPQEVINEMVRERVKQFSATNSQFWRAINCTYVARLHVWWKMDNVDRQQLFARLQNRQGKQRFAPQLSIKSQSRILLLLICFDYIAVVIQVVTCVVTILLWITFFLRDDITLYSWTAIIWLIGDLLLAHYIALRVIHIAIFTTYCSIFGSLIYPPHVIKINQSVCQIMNQHRRKFEHLRSNDSQIVPLLPYKHRHTIWTHFNEHNKIGYLLICGSKDLFSQFLIAFIITNLPINIYIIQRNTFDKQDATEQMVMLAIFGVQVFITLIAILPLAGSCKVMHSPKNFIPTLQMLTGAPKWLLHKLKYDDLYGKLLNGPKIGVSMGPMEVVTYSLSFECLLIYVGYILMAFSSKIERDMAHAKESTYG